jgi:O-antigen/teichoic acid export membrane protein
MTAAGGDLASATVRGVGWTAAAQVAKQLAQMMISIVIARLLLPSAFGQIAQIVVLAGLGNLVSDFGFGAALVQRSTITEAHRSSVFWLQLALGGAMTAALAAASGVVASFYGDADLRPLALLLAPNFVLLSVATAQRSLLTRDLRFRALAVVDVASLVIGGVVGVALAVRGHGVESLVWSTLANSTVTAIALWSAATWRPTLRFDRGAIGELLPFSRNLLGFSFVNYAVRNGDNLLIGRLLGATALGLYTRGYSILLYPNRQISGVIGKVMFASMSRMNDDEDRLRRVYLRTVGVIALVTFPVMTGLALVAAEFVPVVLGQQWVAAVPIIRVFCLLGACESITTTVGWIYQSTGRTDMLLRWALIVGGVPLLGIVVGALVGTIEAVTIAYAVVTTVLLYPSFRSAGRLIGMEVGDVVRVVAGAATCTAAMAIAVGVASWALPPGVPTAFRLAAKCAIGAAAYLAAVHVAGVTAYVDLRETLATQLRHRPRGAST